MAKCDISYSGVTQCIYEVISYMLIIHHHLLYSTGHFSVHRVPGSTPVHQYLISAIVIVITNKVLYNPKQFVMYNMRDNNMLVQPRFRTTKHGYKSIAYQGAKMWNSLPCHIKVLDNHTSFKSELAKWVAVECKCGTCFTCKF